MDDVPSREELRKSKVVELRQKLSEAGLPQTGLKEELITRLIEHYEKGANGGGESEDEMSVDGEESDKSSEKSASEAEMSPATDSPPGVPVADVTQEVSHPVEPAAPVTQSEPVPPAKQILPPPVQQPAPHSQPHLPPQLSAPPAHPPGPPAHLPGPPAHPPTLATGPPAHPPALATGPPALPPGPPAPATIPPAYPPGPPAPATVPPAHPPGPPAPVTFPPAHPPGPPAHLPGPPAHPPGPPAHLPGPPAHGPAPATSAPTHIPGPPARPPGPPAHPPGPPAHAIGPPAHPNGPPAHPTGIVAHPPGPPAHAIGPPAHPTGPPAHPSGIAAHIPGPPARPPGLPARPPGPPARPPGPPAHPPGPPAHPPGPPVRHQPPHQPPVDVVSAIKSHQITVPSSASKPAVQNGSNDTGKSKNKKKKKKRRRRKHNQTSTAAGDEANEPMDEQPDADIEIQYVPETIETDNPSYKQFQKIFDAFKLTTLSKEGDLNDDSAYPTSKGGDKKLASKDESDDEEEEKEAPKVSKKKLRKLNRLSVAQLKQLVNRPDVVEMHDATAQDPKLLIHLKSTRNTVPVPRHWCFKRKYLQGKRGIEKPPFDLPEFIKSTGVMEMRQALEDKEDQKTLKQKTRERVRPKMGKLTIDYQKLHDAFFKWQTKPKMTIHGDMYYEGKEFETRLRQKKPGELSDELRRALGMPTGVGKQKFPPPWLIAMQRYGPPPSYPNLKIPGLNTPIPDGCSFGYFVGGWGKPPVDETGRPLYGDVFGLESHDSGAKEVEQDVDKEMWGELEPEEESSSEEEEEEESEEEGPGPEDIQAGLVTPSEGIATPSGLTSIPAGLETPEMIQLRKKKIEEAMEQGGDTPALYTVLPEKPAAVGGAMMGSSHVYDLAAAVPGSLRKTPAGSSDGVEVALDPSELDLDAATMTARYEEQLREQQGGGGIQKEDLSDMVAEHAARQKNKRKKVAADQGKATKKIKEFKF